MTENDEKLYPLVSCIVTCYQKIPLLYEAIDSVLVQDYASLELLVTDDGSKDFPSEQINAYIDGKKGRNVKRYYVIHNDENVGTVRNIRRALNCASGQFCINLDGDDAFHHNTVISEIVSYMNENDLDFIGTGKIKCDDQLNGIETLPSEEERSAISRMNTPRKQLHSFAVFQFFNIASGSGMAYRRDRVQELGLFDESFRNWQDGPSLVSYVKRGYLFVCNPSIVATKYRDGGVSNSPENNQDAFVHISEDRKRFIERVTIPDRWNPHVFRRRSILFRYYWDVSKTNWGRIKAFLRYPEQGIKMRIRKHKRIFRKK